MVKKAESPAPKKEYRIVRYLKETRAELGKVVWPSRRNATNLTGIVLAVTASMSLVLGLIDWIFSKLIALIVNLGSVG